MSAVTGLRGVLLETPDLDAARRFYAEVWGLVPLPSATPVRCHFRARGPEPWVLGLVQGPQRRLLQLRLAVASPGDADALYDRLRREGVALPQPPAPLEGPGGYYGFELADPDGRRVEISATTGPTTVSGRSTPAPIRASHLVLNSPEARECANFYTRLLGFSISDWYEGDAIIFMRCNEDHHCVGIGQGHNTALNHVAFLVDDEAAVLQAGEQAAAAGAQPVWGPGRHGPGGNVLEYTAELIQIPDGAAWDASEWRRTPAHANVWGTGGPTPLAIQLMNGD